MLGHTGQGGDVNVIMIGLPTRAAGLAAMDRIDWAVDEGRISVDDVAMAYRDDKGKVKIQQTADATAGRGAVKGGALGVLVGLFAAPLVGAAAVGAGVGALVGKARDKGISDKLMKQAGELIEGSEAALFVLADDMSTTAISAVLEEEMAAGTEVSYAVLPAEAQDFLRETIKLGTAV
jgi:uncharacterized membrane protein